MPDAGKHVIVESYPAIYPEPPNYGQCTDEHCRDAWRVLQWVLGHHEEETLGDCFNIAHMPFERADVGVEQQVRFEGWIFGVR